MSSGLTETSWDSLAGICLFSSDCEEGAFQDVCLSAVAVWEYEGGSPASLDLALQEGTILGLLGTNGAGNTTAVRILQGYGLLRLRGFRHILPFPSPCVYARSRALAP